jgi:hypothetical protein
MGFSLLIGITDSESMRIDGTASPLNDFNFVNWLSVTWSRSANALELIQH